MWEVFKNIMFVVGCVTTASSLVFMFIMFGYLLKDTIQERKSKK